MNLLEPADAFHLRAAEGWLELGNHLEASEELERITPELQGHSDVLYVRWHIYRVAKKWDACLEIARALTQGMPKDPRGWIALAQSHYYEKRHQDAYDIAVSKITAFPRHWPLYYDAACYACLTGRLEQAKQFLQLAMTFGEANAVQLRARDDPDFAGLWTEKPPDSPM